MAALCIVFFIARPHASCMLYAICCRRVSLCLSVYHTPVLYQNGFFNVESHKERHTIPQGPWFSDTKDLDEIWTGSPLTCDPNPLNQTTLISTFYVAFRIFVLVERQ